MINRKGDIKKKERCINYEILRLQLYLSSPIKNNAKIPFRKITHKTREIPLCGGAFIPLGRFTRASNGQLTQSEIILYVAHNNEKQVWGHSRPRRRSRDEIRAPNVSDLSFARCNLLIPDRRKSVRRIYIAPPTSPARTVIRKETIAYFILGRAPNSSSRPSP